MASIDPKSSEERLRAEIAELKARLAEAEEAVRAIRSGEIEAERAVQETQSRLRDALAAADLGTWNLDTRTGKFNSDERFRAIFGCPVNGLSAEEALANLHPDDLGWVTTAVEAATRPIDPVPYDVEYRVKHPDGSVRWVAAKGSARFLDTPNGRELAGFEGTVGDTTQRKRAELDARFLAEVSQDLATLSDVAAIMEVVGAKLGAHLALSLCNFVDVSEAADESVVTYAWHRPDVPSSIGRYKLSEYLSAEFQGTLRSGEPFIVRDTSADPRTNAAAYAALKMGSFVCMPLVREGRWRFMLNSHHSVAHDWSTAEIALLRELTARVWTRLERVRIEGELRESETRLAAEAQALRDARQRFDLVKDSTQVGFWFCDLPFDKLDWDDRVKEHFWLPPDAEITIQTFYERIYPEDREPTRQAIEASIANKARYEIEYRTLSPDNRVKWIRAIGRGFYDGDGRPVRFDGVTLDVTERRQAELLLLDSEVKLREGRERLQAALNGSGAGTFRWNIQTNALEWDENLDRLFGLPPGQTIRSLEKFIAFIHPDERPGVIERCNRCAGEGANFDMEFRIIWPDGSIRWLIDQGATFRDPTGRPLYMTGMCLDITESKKVEESLRTAKERAEAASRSKDDFLAALSHELRTPLTPVLMTAAALKDDPSLSEDIREQLEMMERNIALEARLIDDLLDLTAISHGKLQMRLERCDLNTLIDRATEMVAQDAITKNLSIESELNASRHVLMADLTRLQQVVWNLLRNAVKFTPSGGKISIRTRERLGPDGKPWLTLEIADTGIGIDPAHLARIFKPFDQGALSGNHRFGGLGLGLAITQAVVIAHGGHIQATSEGVGLGATFVIDLPHVLTAQSLLAEEPQRGPAKPTAEITPLRLLLVEDHQNTLQTIARLLQRDGHHVTSAMTIASAHIAAAQHTYDLVISDLGLPDGSGTELMEKLRSSHGLRGIALSGYGMQEDIARSREAGFVAHLVKPVAIADLRRVLEEVHRA